MMLKEEKLHLKKLLADAIPLLCKNGLPLHSMFRVEAMIGITVDESEVTLICFKETVTSDGELLPQVYGLDEDVEETEECERFSQAETGNHSTGTVDQLNETSSQLCAFRNNENRSRRGTRNSTKTFTLSSDRVKLERSCDPEMDTEGYLDSGHEANPGGYLYRGDAAQDGGYDGQAVSASQSENEKSHAAGSEQFLIKEEVDLDVEDCMFVKEEQGIDPAAYSQSFDYGHPSDSVPSKSRSRKAHHVFPDFSQEAQVAMQQSVTWQRKMKNSGPTRNRKLSGNGLSSVKVARNSMPMAAVDMRSRGSTAAGGGYSNMIQGLCDSLLQQATQNGEQFVCHMCEAKLSNATTLRNHIRGTHLALKTERCNICGESFKWAMQLARHKKREHGDGSFIHVYNTGGSGGTSVAGREEY